MTPDRTTPGGNFRVEQTFKGVGLIRKSLGTKDLRVFRQRVALLEKLEKREAYEVLRAFDDDRITIEQLVEADAKNELAFTLSGMALRENLWDAIERVLPTMAESEATRYRYATSLRALQRKGAKWLGPRAKVADLAHMPWRALKAKWGASGTDWMHMRRAVSRFLTLHLGKVHHPFRLDVMDKDNFPTAREKKRHPSLALAEFQRILDHVPEHLCGSYWCIVLTGMRLNEYTRCRPHHLNAAAHSLRVPGRKTEASDAVVHISPRLWGFITAAIPCRVQARWLQTVWLRATKAAGTKVTIHDLRHVHGHWAIDEGVAESKVQSSYRHTSAAMTRGYVQRLDTGEVSEALADKILGKEPESRRQA